MDRIKIKTKAKEQIKGRLWEIWRPILLLMIAISVIAALSTTTRMLAPIGMLISIFVLPFINVGIIAYFLKIARGEEFSFDTIMEYKSTFFTAFVLGILISVFVALWTLLLIIPGIIAAYSYMMSTYILADNKELSPMECIKESKEMMRGHKMDYFILQLSFFGWAFLGAFTFGILYIWLIPYMNTTNAIWYDELKNLSK